MRSRLIKALNNRFCVKFMQFEIGLLFSIPNRALSWAITSFGNKFCLKMRSRLIKALNNRFCVKFMQFEIGLLKQLRQCKYLNV